MIKVKPLSIDDMEVVRGWRHEAMETLRTPYMLTREQQIEYYKNVICDRNSTTRYYGFWIPDYDDEEEEPTELFIAYGGIENIEWVNRRGEISLIVDPENRSKGYGRQCVSLILDIAFNKLNLKSVHGESYECGSPDFWKGVLGKWVALYSSFSLYLTKLPKAKYYDGKYWDSLFFNIEKVE